MDNSFHLGYHVSHEQGPHQRQGSPRQVYHGYRQVVPSVIESGVHHNPSSNSSPNAARMTASPPPRHIRQSSMRSVQSSPRMLQSSPRFQRTGTPTSSVGRAAYSMSPPPLFDSSSRGPQRTEAQLIDDPTSPITTSTMPT